MTYVAVKYLHIISLFILVSVLALQYYLLKQSPQNQIKQIARVDMFYGLTALAVLLTGLSLWFFTGKPADFYSKNPIFHLKVSLFVTVGLLSIWPTYYFIRHRKTEAQAIPGYLLRIIKIELILVALIPLLAVLMAQGYGLAS